MISPVSHYSAAEAVFACETRTPNNHTLTTSRAVPPPLLSNALDSSPPPPLPERTGHVPAQRFALGQLLIDTLAHEVNVAGREVALTAREFALLVHFCAQPGRVLSRKQLLSQVWGNAYAGGIRTVDTHVRRLRAKLGPSLGLETLRGVGYKLRVQHDAQHAQA